MINLVFLDKNLYFINLFGIYNFFLFFFFLKKKKIKFWKIWVRVYTLGPERGWAIGDQDEVRGNSDGSLKQCWRANRLSKLPIGAKD